MKLESVMHLPDFFQWGTQTYIMGIINTTPDSFSGAGLGSEDDPVQAAVELGKKLVADGAHLLDVGGESTRPGATDYWNKKFLGRAVPEIRHL